jgi:hypothetical protein
MGAYTDKFRQLTEKLPKKPSDFQGPEFASMCMAQLTNITLQTLASLEEALEDAQKENERLQEMLMEKMVGWEPTKED